MILSESAKVVAVDTTSTELPRFESNVMKSTPVPPFMVALEAVAAPVIAATEIMSLPASPFSSNTPAVVITPADIVSLPDPPLII